MKEYRWYNQNDRVWEVAQEAEPVALMEGFEFFSHVFQASEMFVVTEAETGFRVGPASLFPTRDDAIENAKQVLSTKTPEIVRAQIKKNLSHFNHQRGIKR